MWETVGKRELQKSEVAIRLDASLALKVKGREGWVKCLSLPCNLMKVLQGHLQFLKLVSTIRDLLLLTRGHLPH